MTPTPLWPSCPTTLNGSMISFGLMVVLFLFGFPMSGIGIISLYTYKKIRIHCILKLLFVVNIGIFWISYVLGVYLYYYCYARNVAHVTPIINLNDFGFIFIFIIVYTLHFVQYIILQINSTSMLCITFSATKYKITLKSMVILVLLIIISTLVLTASLVIFYISLFDKNALSSMNISIQSLRVIIFLIGVMFIILSNKVLVFMFVRRLFLMIKDQSHVYLYSLEQSKKQTTRKNPMIQCSNINSSGVNTNYSQLFKNNSISVYSEDNITNKEQVNTKAASKLVIITLIGYITAIIVIGCVATHAFASHNYGIHLIAGFACNIWSMLTILYMYLHFSFSDEIYYNKLYCCVKCDEGCQRILFKTALKSVSDSKTVSLVI